MAGKLFLLGNTVVEISGDHPVADLVRREQAPCTVDGMVPDIHFVLTSETLPNIPENTKAIGPVFALPDRAWIYWDRIGYRVLVSWTQNTKPRINVQVQILPIRKRLLVPKIVYRWRNWTFLNPLEQRAYSFINGVLETLLLFFGENTALLHASVVTRAGQALVFASTGGTGKTTSSLLLVKRHGFKYLADDIALVTADGQVHFYPRYIMMYAYNLLGFRDIEQKFLDKWSLGNRLHWVIRKHIYGPKGVRRRIPPAELYGRNISASAPIWKIFFLVRYSGDKFRKIETSPTELSKVCSHVILAECSYYINYLRYWEATGYAPLTVNNLQIKIMNLYMKAFAHASELSILYIPFEAHPQLLLEYITEVIRDA